MTPIRLRIRELREARGLSQAQLAHLAGTRQATISDYETGTTTRPDLGILDRIAKALGVPPGDLLEHQPTRRGK